MKNWGQIEKEFIELLINAKIDYIEPKREINYDDDLLF